jgi:hypothetical protein
MARATRTAAVLAGCAVMAYGGWGLFLSHQVGHSANLILWLAASLFTHDAVIAPAAFALCWASTRLLPARARPWAAGVLLSGGAVLMIGLPALVWAGRDPNPTVLPLDYGRNILLVLLLVTGVAIAAPGAAFTVRAARRALRSHHAASREGPDDQGTNPGRR